MKYIWNTATYETLIPQQSGDDASQVFRSQRTMAIHAGQEPFHIWHISKFKFSPEDTVTQDWLMLAEVSNANIVLQRN